MAPTPKRPSSTVGMEPAAGTESAQQNSITVAAGVGTPTGSIDSETGSARRSSNSSSPPAGVSKPVDVEEDVPRPPASARHTKDGSTTSNGHAMPSAANNRPPGRDYYHEYEFSDLDAITIRQLNEDICAYNYDLDYCKAQLEDADLTPQETRTLQLRTLDLGHQIRHCKHRIQTIEAQTRKKRPYPVAHTFRTAHRSSTDPTAAYAAGNGVPSTSSPPHATAGGSLGSELGPGRRGTASGKRQPADEDGGSAKRVKMASPESDVLGPGGGEGGPGGGGGVNTALQRLGFWKCRLCSAPKYLLAGAGRTPAAPCKWPLKDISKMITHFTEMHAEHTPAERCAELGAALVQNRGPFEYWLRRTRAQNISDPSVIDECLDILLEGEMPDLLRRHSRAAAGMPFSH
ncbi:4d97ab5c-d0ac-4a16-8be1-167ba92b1c21 [Thermothielavioides terrestris]|uniref:4d97ab5c-d0ac-4a16-8be1-167ba92b1c21 n=1 Tax=Thermothielavioides terrestris TaxID=2587410 RepID=A0A446BQQ5_9PEZI|nr:4d97ab5c-d0ac-4a16-8be1-167ba92b1c21 [Thermothielavioides terrestris]